MRPRTADIPASDAGAGNEPARGAAPWRAMLGWRDAAIALALAAVFLTGGAARAVFGVCGVFHDDGIYVSTARAIAEGEGYVQLSHPGRLLETKFPHLYPFLLAQIWRIWPSFPANLLAMQGLSLLAGAGMVALSYLYLVRCRYVPRSAAAAACALTATAATVLYFGSRTMSEMPFAVLFITACWTLERQIHTERRSRVYEFGLGVLLATPFLCRVIGIGLPPIALVLLYRSKRRLRWVLGGVVLAVAPWIIWSRVAAPPPDVHAFYTDYVGWWLSATQSELARVVGVNLLRILGGLAWLGLDGLSQIVPRSTAGFWYLGCVAIGLAGLIGLALQARRGRVLPWCLLAYLGPVVIWPWPAERFLVPILPLMLSFPLAMAFASHSGGRTRRIRTRLTLVVISVGLLANGRLLYGHAQRSAVTGYPHVYLSGKPVSWQQYEDAFAWLRANANRGDVVAAGMDAMTHLYTGLPAFRPFRHRPLALFYGAADPPVGSVNELTGMLTRWRARYLMLCPMHGFAEAEPFAKLVAEFRQTYPDWARPVYRSADGEIELFELRSPTYSWQTAKAVTADASACAEHPPLHQVTER